MARTNIVVGLDVGTSTVYTVVSQRRQDSPAPQIIGIGRAPSSGMRKGTVAESGEAIESILRSVQEAERLSGVSIERAYVSIGGEHIVAMPSRGVVAVSRADGEISEEDVERVLDAAKAVSLPQNREIVHVIPHEYVVDNEGGLKDALGMSGIRLEANTLIIGGATPHIKNLYKCVEEAGLRVDGFVLAPLAAAQAVLSRRQKELGVVCLDIGGGTTGLAVYEEGKLLHTCVLPVGGMHITNDLAIGLRISVDTAEIIKREYGVASTAEIPKREVIELSSIDPSEEGTILRREVGDIIEARLSEIFELANRELRKVGKEAFLPGGAVLVGGGAKIAHIVDLAKERMRLPAQIGFPRDVEGIVDSVDDPSFATALGLVFWGFERMGGDSSPRFTSFSPFDKTLSKLRRWGKTFLP